MKHFQQHYKFPAAERKFSYKYCNLFLLNFNEWPRRIAWNIYRNTLWAIFS